MLDQQHVLDLLSPEDLELLKLMDAKAKHPDLLWSGCYRDGKFVASVVGPLHKDGTRFEAISYAEKDTWEVTHKGMLDSICINYPELMNFFYPEYE